MPSRSSSPAASATAPHATQASVGADRQPRHAGPGEVGDVRTAREQQHVHGAVDGCHDGADVVDREQAGRVEHVGAGLLVRLQPGDRVAEVLDTADEVLGAGGQHQPAGARRLDRRRHPLGGGADRVDAPACE